MGKLGMCRGNRGRHIRVSAWGILLGPFVGAFVGELLGGKASGDALKAGFGAFAGFLLSVVLKVNLCGYFIYSFVRGIIN